MNTARLSSAGHVSLFDGEVVPAVGDGESLVRVLGVGLCGSDLHWFGEGSIGDAVLSHPLVLGHEFGGRVEGGPLDGQLVAVDPAIPCGTCERCREGYFNLCPTVRFAGHGGTDGGLREYVSWPTELLHVLPEGFTPATAALLEALGVALHAFDLGHMRLGSSVAVVGCGPIGLMLLQACRAAGAGRLIAIEPLAHRREAAKRCGAQVVLAPGEIADCLDEFDVVFEAVGPDDAVAESVELVRPGGNLVLAGIPNDDKTTLPASVARRKGLTVRLVRRMNEAYPRAIDMVRRGLIEVDWLVSHRFPLERIDEAFKTAAAREGLKVLVEP